MPLAATSYDAQVSTTVCTMLSVLSSFQAWTGTGSPTLALACIAEDDSGTTSIATNNQPLNTANNWASVRVKPSERPQRAFMTFGRTGSFEIVLIEHYTSGDEPPEVIRRARNNAGQIRDDFQAIFGANAAYIVFGEIELGESALQDAIHSMPNCVVTSLLATWRDIP